MTAVCFSIGLRVTAAISCATARAAALFQCRSCIKQHLIRSDAQTIKQYLIRTQVHSELAMQNSFAKVTITCKTSISTQAASMRMTTFPADFLRCVQKALVGILCPAYQKQRLALRGVSSEQQSGIHQAGQGVCSRSACSTALASVKSTAIQSISLRTKSQ